MKKVALSFVAFALFVGGAFAQAAAPAASVGIGAWGRGIYAPLASNNSGSPSGVTAGIGTSWGNSPRIGFTIHGDSQYVGFLAHIGVDNNQFSITDDTQIWIKPFDGLELQLGRAFNDTLRGEGSFGSWNWIRTVGMYQGDDAVFKRIGGLAGGAPGPQNAIVSYSNSGLFLFWEQAEQGAGPTALTTYSDASANGGLANASYGAGYTIPNVGQLRVQNIGFADNGSTSVGQLQAAFRLTGVQNLYADIGIWIPTNVAGVTTSGTTTAANIAGYDFQIPFYANYKVDKATVHLGFNYKSLNSYASVGAQGAYDVAIGADYDMGSGVGLTGDFQIGNKYWATNSNGDAPMSFLLGATKGFSNGSIGIGFQYSKLGFVATAYPGNYSADTNAEWALPIKVEYWF
ncbi:MAG: hypothetical protein HKM05_01170 [Spirochaetales bacterium]|jgi:hypothetical protein|nr:hypothetical protein [Spirochaetales bacterium]